MPGRQPKPADHSWIPNLLNTTLVPGVAPPNLHRLHIDIQTGALYYKPGTGITNPNVIIDL